MKEFEIVTKIKLWSFEELHPNDRQLVEMAIKATEGAYAEYSHFYVGAAARLADGTIVTGANQENAAFPSGPAPNAQRSLLHRQTIRHNPLRQ